MRLRNKETGEIIECPMIRVSIGVCDLMHYEFPNSLAELNEKYEDYKPKEPLIKDEKIRKAVRVWAEANNINHNHYYETDVVFDSFEHCLTWIDTSIQFNEITGLENLEDGKKYTIAELCGENDE